jgi:O-antigen ligase
VQFSLYNPVPGTVVEVDQVRLLDARGQDLLRNGDFAQGGDFWFFKSGDHLFWHAKNLWVHLLFEQGWLGVVSFTLILILALVRLGRAMARGALQSTVLLASIGAWIMVGGVDSLVDAPRLALLVYGLLFIGAAWGTAPGPAGHRKRRHHHRPQAG